MGDKRGVADGLVCVGDGHVKGSCLVDVWRYAGRVGWSGPVHVPAIHGFTTTSQTCRHETRRNSGTKRPSTSAREQETPSEVVRPENITGDLW